ncbi:membrane dipeptidase [Paenibacillus woosongensis]|uniref:Membrane dipeptidase n=1 Tax=Paenibacillus woosongensis TaxID=307580 RepID=A0AA95I8Z5_9BACL|nr:membrane dipeptidase [Paenibacillus woosongensis]WHX51456.1 membrane dipeptidase [Paenibacillus woosongensis]
MKVADFHCDALSKMRLHPEMDFTADDRLDVSAKRMVQGNVKLQCFAIFLSKQLGTPNMGHILDQIDVYNARVVPNGIFPIRYAEELEQWEQEGKQGGLLALEGADGLEGNLHYLQVCFELGVRLLGITWNHANWAADGILEQRNGGFTLKGVQLVELSHQLEMILDVSHLSQKGFWELVELSAAARRPFIASHSNAYAVCDHVRNLHDEQIQAIIRMNGRIGVTFVPWFVHKGGAPSSKHLLPHIEHICALGGEHHIMFGSDFDGIEEHLSDLDHCGRYLDWAEMLLKHYPERLVRGWLYDNAVRFLRTWLPKNK